MSHNGGFTTIQKLVIDRGELREKSGSLLFHFRQGPVRNGNVFHILSLDYCMMSVDHGTHKETS
ncbi:hypothetical protein M378DRAFT_173196 [Amanita muscaria Koide BX008]|uniref:Uncharacterized protein n=2 Tax=Amanita muscaria (strain Koide BX008) TaxID=946122 RepID=A0A0C2RZS6_AMAMK|nr:hypothetical protein M378DRAFT_173196 [Amanita muscaria Koide BX008]